MFSTAGERTVSSQMTDRERASQSFVAEDCSPCSLPLVKGQ